MSITNITDRERELQAQVDALKNLANALLHQIDIGTFIDEHGHSAKMLKATHDLTEYLAQPGEIA